MSTQTQLEITPLDIVKQVASGLSLIFAIVAFYYFSEIAFLYRVIGLLLVVSVILIVIYTTNYGKKLFGFFIESKQEVRRVVWPTRDETTRTTLLVFAMVFSVGIVLWLLDMFLFWGVRMLTGQGG